MWKIFLFLHQNHGAALRQTGLTRCDARRPKRARAHCGRRKRAVSSNELWRSGYIEGQSSSPTSLFFAGLLLFDKMKEMQARITMKAALKTVASNVPPKNITRAK
mmetsp:Transcript_114870/g.324664  ORF Transcript_114870/g.324664 Transcript_114870/m.324664 type:complete len:105 (-) Transcript_114870:889-1203(-)